MTNDRYVEALPASQVARERVEWLVPGRIPYGAVTLLVGDGGEGKSTWACLVAGETSHHSGVLMATAEDSLTATVRPRLEAVRANLASVHFLIVRTSEGDEDGIVVPDDLPRLGDRVSETGARLLVIDPLVAHLSPKLNTWSDHSVRRALSALHRLAEEQGIAILAIIHINKGHSNDPAQRISGSAGFRNAARSMLVFGRDPNDDDENSPRRLLAHSKSNYSPLAPTLAYEIRQIVLPAEGSSHEIETTRLVGVGESTVGHRDVFRRPDEPDDGGSAIDAARAFLRNELADGPRPTRHVVATAQELGIAERTLRRAQRELGVQPRKTGFHGSWEWALPEDRQPPRPSSTDAADGQLRLNGLATLKIDAGDPADDPKAANAWDTATFAAPYSWPGGGGYGDDAEIAALLGVDESDLDAELDRFRVLAAEARAGGSEGSVG